MVRVRRFQALGDEQAEQILGEEIGRVQRIDVGAQRRAQRGGEVAAALRSRRSGRGSAGAARCRARRSRPGRARRRNNRRCGAGRCPAPDWRGAAPAMISRLRPSITSREADERADPGAVGGHFGMGAPAAIGVAVEAVAGRDVAVDAGKVDADRVAGGGRGGERRWRRGARAGERGRAGHGDFPGLSLVR